MLIIWSWPPGLCKRLWTPGHRRHSPSKIKRLLQSQVQLQGLWMVLTGKAFPLDLKSLSMNMPCNIMPVKSMVNLNHYGVNMNNPELQRQFVELALSLPSRSFDSQMRRIDSYCHRRGFPFASSIQLTRNMQKLSHTNYCAV